MRKQKKDDKRVLMGRPNNNKNTQNQRRNNMYLPTKQKQKRKPNSNLVLLMIIALIAFVIGAGIGVSLSFDIGAEEEAPQYENVTVEMTSNLNETEPIYYDSDLDDVDYNNQYDLAELNLTNNTTTLNF